MKKLIAIVLMLVFIFTLTACGDGNFDNDSIQIPADSSDFEGENYQDVVIRLELAGFTNIETEIMDDLITGWLTEDGSVEKVSINGDTEFSAGDQFPMDAIVKITYHTFPESVESVKSDSSIEQRIGYSDDSLVSSRTDESASDTELAEEILTTENNEDLALLFENGEDEDACNQFVERYKGRIIEFDGNIAYMNPHADYDTRFDFLIYAGDYNEDSANGSPAMQFNNVSVHDLNLIGDDIPEYIEAGTNIHVTAKVDGIVNNYLILLTPISTQIRHSSESADISAEEITVNGTLNFLRNEYATISITGIPNTEYHISVFYHSGESTAAGLESNTSDANGNISWTWKIGGKTTPGTYHATIVGGGETIIVDFTVG